MKKFDIKWILILVLVIILAFGLVACNNKGGGDQQEEEEEEQVNDPNKSTPGEFFAALWDSSKSIGATEVNPNTDKVHIGLAMDLSLTSTSVKELDVGLEMGIVADLASMNKSTGANLGDTALMIKAFDKITKDNWVTLWYFLSDKDYLYFQVQDEKFKVKFDAYWNAEFSTLLQGVLEMPIDFLSGVDNLLDLIDGIAASGGNKWTLDTLILGDGKNFDGLLAAFGLDLKKILSDDTVKNLLKSLGVSINASGDISIGDILQSLGSVVLDAKTCKKYVDGTKTTYVAGNLSKTATGLLDGFTDKLFGQISSTSLSFNVVNNKIDDFTIAITGKKSLNNTEIKINITDLVIETTTKDASEALGKAGTYDPYVNIDWTGRMNASAWGAKLNIDGEQISIGNVVAQLKASIDLTGAKGENKTAAQLIITNDNQKVLTVEYKDSTLILETDLSNANNAKIAKVGLYPLAKLIKEAAVGTDTKAVPVPYKIFGDMADDVISGMFTITDGKVTEVKSAFTTIAITNVDIEVLAKGAFYAIFSDFATKAGEEKPAEAAELTTFDENEYKYGSASYTDNQYPWSLNILETVKVVLGAIKYDESSKDYSITLEKLSTTLLGVFKDAESKDKLKATKPANVDEMMALFMCTNDGLLLDLTKHGLLPLYDKTTGITNKYITSDYSADDAVKDGYYAISGKMISKADALCIWKFYTGATNTIKQPVDSKGKVLDNTVIASEVTTIVNGEGETYASPAAYAADSAIQWFVKLVAGSTVTNGLTAQNIVGTLAGETSKIMISLNRKTGKMACDVKLNNLSTTGDITYTISGTDDACSFTSTTKAATAANVVVDLDNNFYKLFKANFGMGPTTVIDSAHENYGINKDLYYLASTAIYEDNQFSEIDYKGAALIRVETSTPSTYEYYVVTKDNGLVSVTFAVDPADSTKYTITGSAFEGVYYLQGNAYQVLANSKTKA